MDDSSRYSVEISLDRKTNNPATQNQRVLQFVENLGDHGSPIPESDDTNYDFFAKGRDFESAFVNHRYTDTEKKILGEYESLDYLPPHSQVYKEWIYKQPTRLDWDYWVMMGIIGFLVGTLGFLLHQFIDLLAELKWNSAKAYIQEGNIVYAWLWVLGISLLYVLLSSCSVVLLRPSAGGSGLPEIIAYLNGAIVRHIFNVKTLGVKFFSCILAVSSGMPVGPEGPMVHLGSLVGAGCSQLKSSTLKIKLPFFKRFRNSEDRRNFISAGAAAGVASAFGSPVGGLLFSMEEVSSFWNMKLSWQTFFCCMVSTFTTDLLNSAFTGFHYQGNFGLFKTEKYILFQVVKRIDLNIIAVLPAALVGILGGIMGAAFTFLNLKISRTRRKILSSIRSRNLQKVFQISEPLIIMAIMASLSVFLPTLFTCTSYPTAEAAEKMPNCYSNKDIYIEEDVELYNCPKTIHITEEVGKKTPKKYNEVATLLFITGEKAIHHLFSRETHVEFNFTSLFVVLPCYFILACWAAGSSISSGVVIPKMFIGGLIGRIVGRLMIQMFDCPSDPYWAWMDPGAFALIGAAAFFGGVARLTMSLTVIMVELTNDVQFLLLIMVAIMVSKWVGDYITHPFYHAQLELKCIPFLDSEPVVLYDGKKKYNTPSFLATFTFFMAWWRLHFFKRRLHSLKFSLNLELFEAQHVMSHPVRILEIVVSVHSIARTLVETNHCGFPIIIKNGELSTFYGLITRTDLCILLCHEEVFVTDKEEEIGPIDYSQFCEDDVEKLPKSPRFLKLLAELNSNEYAEKYINLAPYANKSAVCVQKQFSLHRTYIIFRSLGLRHLTVVDDKNQIAGIITRKDLMGFNIETKLLNVMRHRFQIEVSN